MGEISVTPDELSRLHKQLSAASAENFELREEIGKLIETNAELTGELDKMTDTLVSTQVAAQQKQQETHEKKSRFDRFVNKVSTTYMRDVVEMQAELDALRAQATSKKSDTARLKAMELNTKHLQNFARESQLKIAEQEKELAELQRYRDLIETQPDLARLSKEAGEAEELRKQVAGLQGATEELQTLRAEAQEMKEGFEKRIREQNELHELDKRSQQQTIDSQTQELQKLQTLFETVQTELSTKVAEAESATAELQAVKGELEARQLDCKSWKEQCEHMGNQLIKHEDFAEGARATSEQHKHALEELEMERGLRKDAEVRLCELQQQMVRLTAQLAEYQREAQEVATLEKKVATLKQTIQQREDTMRNNQLGYDNMKRELSAAMKVADERNIFKGQVEELSRFVSHSFCSSIVSELVMSAVATSDARCASELPAARKLLQEQTALAAARATEIAKFDQRLADLKSEHRIETRKKDSLIKELQSQLRSEALAASTNCGSLDHHAAEGAPLRSSPSALSLQDQASDAATEMSLLHKEEAELIHRIASLKEANWKLEEEKRNQLVTIRHLQEDNNKKNAILQHCLSSPVAQQLLRTSDPKKAKASSSWMSMAGMSMTSSGGPAKDTLQSVLQDALAENILLHQKVDELKASLQAIKSAK